MHNLYRELKCGAGLGGDVTEATGSPLLTRRCAMAVSGQRSLDSKYLDHKQLIRHLPMFVACDKVR